MSAFTRRSHVQTTHRLSRRDDQPGVEAFLDSHHTVIIPTGATEQHGPHGPLATDVLIPQEVARRVAPQIGAVVAPPISYALSYPHVGFTGLVHIRDPDVHGAGRGPLRVVRRVGFRRIIFLNGHYDNTYAIAYACANAAERMPKGVKAFPVNYWDGLTADEIAEFSGPEERPARERRGDLGGAGDQPGPGRSRASANAEFPPFPEFTVNTAPVHTAFFFSIPGSVHRATKIGTWGDARGSNAGDGRALHRGRRPLDAGGAGQHREDLCGDAGPVAHPERTTQNGKVQSANTLSVRFQRHAS